jgi:protein gp37
MSARTGIGWCDHTFNTIWGCARVSEACRNCYAESLAHRYGFDVWGVDKERRTFGAKHWAEPLKWNRAAEASGVRHRVFCSSMGDVFENHLTVLGELPKLWDLIRRTPMLGWLLLTKRPERITTSLPADWGDGYKNVRLGATLESHLVEWRADALRAVPAHSRFLSCEPLLSAIDERCFEGMSWVIIGGESGHGARPMHPNWARGIRDACAARGIPTFFKQWGLWEPREWKHDGATHALGLRPTEFLKIDHHPNSLERTEHAPDHGRAWQGFERVKRVDHEPRLDGIVLQQFPSLRIEVPA